MAYGRNDKVGDTLEISLWYNADHPEEHDSAKEGIYKVFLKTEQDLGMEMGPINFEILEPGDERVPEPNPDFSGTPKLLVGFGDIVKIRSQQVGEGDGFSKDLEHDDLMKLRKVTQDKHKLYHPNAPLLTDEELDTIIDETGPETAARRLH